MPGQTLKGFRWLWSRRDIGSRGKILQCPSPDTNLQWVSIEPDENVGASRRTGKLRIFCSSADTAPSISIYFLTTLIRNSLVTETELRRVGSIIFQKCPGDYPQESFLSSIFLSPFWRAVAHRTSSPLPPASRSVLGSPTILPASHPTASFSFTVSCATSGGSLLPRRISSKVKRWLLMKNEKYGILFDYVDLFLSTVIKI